MTDLNSVVLVGRLAAPPEMKYDEPSGARVIRCLVTVRTEQPTARVDVIPVTIWEPQPDTWDAASEAAPGSGVAVHGSVQRRFWNADTAAGERRSRLEVVATALAFGEGHTDPGCAWCGEAANDEQGGLEYGPGLAPEGVRITVFHRDCLATAMERGKA